MSKLIITIEGKKFDEVRLHHGTMYVGRDKDNDIRLNGSSVSAKHAKIVTFFEPSYIQDQNSTNGTYVNDKCVNKHTMRNGDVITIGKYHLIFEFHNDGSHGDDDEKTLVLSTNEIDELLKHASGDKISEIADGNLLPDEVQWVAQEEDGTWYGFSHSPIKTEQGWLTENDEVKHELIQCPPNPEWKKSKRKL